MRKSKSKSRKSSSAKSGTNSQAGAELSRKEQKALQRKAAREKKEFIQSLSTSFGISIFLGALLAIAVDPKIGVAMIVGIPCMMLSNKYPRQGIWAFLIYMPFGGTVTYWLAGGNSLSILAKDAFFIPALLSFVKDCQRKRLPILVPKGLVMPMGLLLAMATITLLSVNLLEMQLGGGSGQPFLQGILGLKVLVGYVPLIFCAYYLIRNKKDLVFVGRLHVVLAIICCVLGLLQYYKLDSGSCQGTRGLVGDALFKATLDAKCLVGGSVVFSPEVDMVRLPGTFPSPWHWAWFLISNAALTFTTAFNDPVPLWRIGGLAGMGLVFINAVISGQRIALMLVPVVIGILLVLTGQIANLKRFLPIGVGLGFALVIAAIQNPAIVQERWDSTVSRWQAAPPQQFIEHQFEWAISKTEGDFFGDGLGVATNSTRAFGDVHLVETFHPKLLVEMGFPGLIAFLIVMTALTVITFMSYRKVQDRVLRSYGSSFWVFILIISYWPYWYPLDTDPVAVYYWFFAGVILKLPAIDKEESRLRAEQEATENNSASNGKTGKRKGKKKKKRRLQEVGA